MKAGWKEWKISLATDNLRLNVFCLIQMHQEYLKKPIHNSREFHKPQAACRYRLNSLCIKHGFCLRTNCDFTLCMGKNQVTGCIFVQESDLMDEHLVKWLKRPPGEFGSIYGKIKVLLWEVKHAIVECFLQLSGDMGWMTVVFSMERFMRRCEQMLEATTPISIAITTTNKLLWVWEVHSTGRSIDPLPQLLTLRMQDENSKTHGICVSVCIYFSARWVYILYKCWKIQYFNSSRPAGN